jgi:hypothetical protein
MPTTWEAGWCVDWPEQAIKKARSKIWGEGRGSNTWFSPFFWGREMQFKKGDESQGVLLLQERLRELGHLKTDEPGFGEATLRAVKEFQRLQGLSVDGVVGPATWSRLFPRLQPTRGYLNGVLYGGREVFDPLDELVATVAAGEGGAFDALQLNADGAGLSFGILQWAQRPGSLYNLLQALNAAQPMKFVQLLADGDPQVARDLLAQTQGGGKRLPLWQGEWPRRFWTCGRDLECQKVQRHLARQEVTARLDEGCRLYPSRFQTGGRIALRALVMLADVANQSGPGGLRRAVEYARARLTADEAAFIGNIGRYLEQLVAHKYGDPDFGNTRGRHEDICRRYPLDRVDWPALRAQAIQEGGSSPAPA